MKTYTVVLLSVNLITLLSKQTELTIMVKLGLFGKWPCVSYTNLVLLSFCWDHFPDDGSLNCLLSICSLLAIQEISSVGGDVRSTFEMNEKPTRMVGCRAYLRCREWVGDIEAMKIKRRRRGDKRNRREATLFSS